MLVKFDEGGFKLLINVAAEMVRVLGLRQTLACLSFLGAEVLGWGFRDCVKRNLSVAGVSVLIELDMGDSLVVGDRGVVGYGVAGKVGEI